jgi:hypothetical protein
MRVKWMAVMTLAAVVALAPQAFAMGGGGGHHGGGGGGGGIASGPVSGTLALTSSTGTTVNGGTPAGTTGTAGTTKTLSAAEPVSAFAVGLGLIGARLLRRRR